jgi:hypothetical protein
VCAYLSLDLPLLRKFGLTSAFNPSLFVLHVLLWFVPRASQASQGVYPDASGPEMARLLQEMSATPSYLLNFVITQTAIVPDSPG